MGPTAGPCSPDLPEVTRVIAGRDRIILLFFRTNQTPNPHY
jgi:hypothetical protein